MKLDLNAVWDRAVSLMSKNREVILVLAGVFFFLPLAVFSLAIPPQIDSQTLAASSSAGGTNPEAVAAALRAWMMQYWWAIVLLSVIQTIGGLAVMAVIGDAGRPTVAEAMKRGASYVATQIAAQILFGLVTFVVVMMLVMLGALTGSKGIASLMGLLGLPVVIFLMTRFALTGPVIAIERIANPLTALKRSWDLVAGNTLRLFIFGALLFIPYVVIGWIFGMLVRLAGALPGADTAAVLEAILSGVINTGFMVVAYAVLASAYRQLVKKRTALSHHVL